MNILSLFDGIRTGHLALQDAGIKVDKYYSSEINDKAIMIADKNFPQDKKYKLGDVVKIDENKLKQLDKIDLIMFGSPCFLKEELVNTINGLINIENINIGDLVKSHDGTYNKVINTMKSISNDIYDIKCGATHNINTTGNHPFYVMRNGNHEWIKSKDLNNNDFMCIPINKQNDKIKWDGIKIRKNIVLNNLPFEDERFWYLIGRYIGDGWVTKRKERNNNISGIKICCGKNKLKKMKEKIGNIFNYYLTEERTVYKFQFCNKELGEFCKQFGMGAINKCIPQNILNLNKKYLYPLLEGLNDSDGCFTNKYYKYSSISKKLVYNIGELVLKLYKVPYHIEKNIRNKKTSIEGRCVNQNNSYTVYWRLDGKINKNINYVDENYLYSRIRKIKKRKELKEVYNIEVEKTHSYCINNIATHNCTGFSRQGKGLNFNDPQSKLFFEAIRIYRWLKENNNPDIKFFMENVEMKKEWKEIINKALGVDGILINSKILSAQNRPRVYWTNIADNIHIKEKECRLLDIIDDNINTNNYIKHEGLLIDPKIIDKNKKVLNLISVVNGEVRIKQATKKGYIVAENGDGVNLSFPTSTTRRGRVIKQKSSTLDQSCNVCIYYDNIIRALNINELERLQTLPDNYTYLEGISEIDRKSAIGNGWTKDIIVEFFKYLK